MILWILQILRFNILLIISLKNITCKYYIGNSQDQQWQIVLDNLHVVHQVWKVIEQERLALLGEDSETQTLRKQWELLLEL